MTIERYIKDLILRWLFAGWFKKKFLRYMRRNRFYYPEVSTDFTFVTQQYSSRPPSAHLTKVCLDCVNNIHDVLIPSFKRQLENGDAKHIFDFRNHYFFLLALANVIQAKQIVEVGTASGSSLWAWLNAKCVEHVNTFDIVPVEDSQHWFTSSTHRSTVNAVLASERRRFTQYVEDLSVDANFANRRSLIEGADIIFIDGPHDGNF